MPCFKSIRAGSLSVFNNTRYGPAAGCSPWPARLCRCARGSCAGQRAPRWRASLGPSTPGP
eukprot:15191703-Alexandrium_andersonii.AAC.1